MTQPRPEYARMPRRTLGYYGLRRWLMIRGCPDWLWRVYWWFQPLRCLFTFHDWYSTAAGLCSACRCGASGAWPTWIAHEYHFKPWFRQWAVRVEEAQFGWDLWSREYLNHFERDH